MSNPEIPTKPYLLRALYEWCVDNGYTPHLAVRVDAEARVPAEYVRNGEITFNIAPVAVHKLQMGNDRVEFSARFAGVARQISVPVAAVFALYARETGHGMTFDIEVAKPALQAAAEAEPAAPGSAPAAAQDTAPPALPGPGRDPGKPGGGKPKLRRIK
jgi:stringent starvation protein B